MADSIIRTLDACGRLNVDNDRAVHLKQKQQVRLDKNRPDVFLGD
jgi:hypothetical protein